MDGCLVLGASNPKMVWKPIGIDPRTGAMLRGHVILVNSAMCLYGAAFPNCQGRCGRAGCL